MAMISPPLVCVTTPMLLCSSRMTLVTLVARSWYIFRCLSLVLAKSHLFSLTLRSG